jgi:hypothetical protein
MSDRILLDLLRDSWLACLLKDCHRVAGESGATAVIRSRNGKNRRYRWLLWVSEGRTRRFSRSELAGIRLHFSRARQLRETLYLVVGFLPEPRRIVVLPASAAMRAGCVRSDKGGIAWED